MPCLTELIVTKAAATSCCYGSILLAINRSPNWHCFHLVTRIWQPIDNLQHKDMSIKPKTCFRENLQRYKGRMSRYVDIQHVTFVLLTQTRTMTIIAKK